MESFNRKEHVVAAFLDVEKAFENVWHNGLRYKIFMLDLPTKMTHWLSDFLVGRVIQVNVNGFLSDQISSAAGVPQGFFPESIIFLIYVNDLPKPHHRQNSKSNLLMTLLYGLLVETYTLQQNFYKRTYENWQSGVPNGE